MTHASSSSRLLGVRIPSKKCHSSAGILVIPSLDLLLIVIAMPSFGIFILSKFMDRPLVPRGQHDLLLEHVHISG